MSNINKGYTFYKQNIYDEQKIKLLKEYNLKVAGHVHSVIWELFCALLTGQKAEGITGADLHGWEVKSAKGSGNFEYQYHRHAHLDKLEEDGVVSHIYCSYSEDYDSVVVRALKGSELREKYFDTWKPECIEKYNNPSNLRFRKNISYKYVQDNGLLVLKVEKGKLTYKNDQFIEQLKIR
jgi:hypothetical protein